MVGDYRGVYESGGIIGIIRWFTVDADIVLILCKEQRVKNNW